MKMYTSRILVSFSGRCPLECKHCYTLDCDSHKNEKDLDEIESIVSSVRGSTFDIIYISHDRENFIDEQAGIKLTESLYAAYKKSILIITRKNLCQSTIKQLAALSKKMKVNGDSLFVAVSIPANSSYGITEKTEQIASPLDRCELLKALHLNGIKSILMARPIFPNAIVPIDEVIEMISDYHEYLDAVVASGLAVNDSILERLGLSESELMFLPGNHSSFLIGSSAKNIKYIDVDAELIKIKKVCDKNRIIFSTHSMDALNQLEYKSSCLAP